jgi:hypothetical protein
MTPINLKGKKFGRLTVLSYDKTSIKSGHAWWYCQCSCEKKTIKSYRASRLKEGTTRSCGCLAKESARKLLTKYANGPDYRDSGNHRWKGDGAKHAAIHTWLNRHFKKKKCEVCGTDKKLHFALKTGETHSHTRSNYRVLCASDHARYDYKSGLKKNQYM